MTHKLPPDSDDRPEAENPGLPAGLEDDLINKVYGPSQADMDRSWEGYENGEVSQGSGSRGGFWKLVVVVVSLVIMASLAFGLIGPIVDRVRVESTRQVQPELVSASVLRVIDARTIVVRLGGAEQTVRLIGLESPIFGDPFYEFARQVSQSWIEGHDVLLEADERDVDEQGRLLRYVFLDNVLINAALIVNGLGRVETEPPNTRYNGFLADMERQARESGVGMWDPRYEAPEIGTRSGNTEASLRTEYFARPLTT